MGEASKQEDLAGYFLRLLILSHAHGWAAERFARLARELIDRLEEVEQEGNEAMLALAVVIEELADGHVAITETALEAMNGKQIQRRRDRAAETLHYRVVAPEQERPSTRTHTTRKRRS